MSTGTFVSDRPLQLDDGTRIELRVDEKPATLSIVALEEGDVAVGQAHAAIVPSGGAADADILVAPLFQRNGVGELMLEQLLRWARDHQVRYLVGTTTADDGATSAFLRSTGAIVARRVRGRKAKLAVLVTEGSRS